MTDDERDAVALMGVGGRPWLQDDPASRALPAAAVDALQERLDEVLARAPAGRTAGYLQHPETDGSWPRVSLAVGVRAGWRVAELRAGDDHHRIAVHPVGLPPGVSDDVATVRLAAAVAAVRVALHAHGRGRQIGDLRSVLQRGLRRDPGSELPGRWPHGSLSVGIGALAARRHALEQAAHDLLYPVPLPRPHVSELRTMPPVGPGATPAQLASASRVFLRQHGVPVKARSVTHPAPGIVVSYLDGPPTHVVERALRYLPDVTVRRFTSPRARATAVVLFARTYDRPPTTPDDIAEIERLLACGDVLPLADKSVARELRAFVRTMGVVVADDIAVLARRYADAVEDSRDGDAGG